MLDHDFITEHRAADEEKRSEKNEAPGVAFFVFVEPRRNELPRLPQPYRRRDDDRRDEGDFHFSKERFGYSRPDQRQTANLKASHGSREDGK